MRRPPTAETQAMAKVQKTVMVLEDLHRLACEFEIKTGANFTRIVTAALVQYLVAPFPPNPNLMSYAVALERGDITLSEILVRTLKDMEFCAQARLQIGQSLDLPEGAPNPLVEEAESTLLLYHRLNRHVEKLQKGDHSIDSFIACWQTIAGQDAKHAMPRDLNP